MDTGGQGQGHGKMAIIRTVEGVVSKVVNEEVFQALSKLIEAKKAMRESDAVAAAAAAVASADVDKVNEMKRNLFQVRAKFNAPMPTTSRIVAALWNPGPPTQPMVPPPRTPKEESDIEELIQLGMLRAVAEKLYDDAGKDPKVALDNWITDLLMEDN